MPSFVSKNVSLTQIRDELFFGEQHDPLRKRVNSRNRVWLLSAKTAQAFFMFDR